MALFWSLPRLIALLPGSVQSRLPEPIVEALTTPLPRALPTPVSAEVEDTSEIFLPSRTQTPFPEPNTLVETPSSTPLNPSFRPSREAVALSADLEVPTLDPSPMPTKIPTSASIAGVKIIPQKFNNCGPANLTMVLNYYGQDAQQLVVGEYVKPNYDDRNVSPNELVHYVIEETELNATTISGADLNLLKDLLAGGYPVIVEKGLLLNEHQGWMGHYLTLIGYDDVSHHFDTLDTFLGPFDIGSRPIEYDELEEMWTHFNHTAIILYPPENESEVNSLMGESFHDQLQMWQTAAEQTQQSLLDEPDNAFLWFNLGTNLTELGEFTGDSTYIENAARAYDRAFQIGLPWRMLWYQFKPYAAYLAAGRFEDVLQLSGALLSSGGGQNVEETYLYRGHAMLATGDLSGAERAYNEALRLNPNMTSAREALSDLEAASS